MNIRIGTKLSIILEGKEDHITSFYVGEKNNQYIVITFPENKAEFSEKKEELNKIRVQYFENDDRYEFKSGVIKMVEDPVDLILLKCPSEIYSINNRSLERINCLVSAKLKNQLAKEVPPIVGVIANINKTGCLCNLTKKESSKMSLAKGDQVDLKCEFPGLIGEQHAEGKIVRIQEEGKDIVLGIQFHKEIWWVPPYDRK